MEGWQEKHVLANFPTLIRCTECTSNLLAVLRSKRILGDADIQLITSRPTPLDKAYRLYEISLTRLDSYAALMSALGNDNQSASLGILYQGLLLNQPLTFQIAQLDLNSFPAEVRPNLSQTDEPFMRHWISNTQAVPELVKNSVPPTLKYYIPRRICTTRLLSPQVFLTPTTTRDIFVVKGIERSQFSAVVSNKEIKYSSSQSRQVTGQYILLEYDGDYDRICELTKAPVHLLHYHKSNGGLSWLKSRGSIALIQKMLVAHQQEFMEEDKFVEEITSSSNPICIADTPGMGKSVILARIGERIMKASPHSVVQFIVFRELVRELLLEKEQTGGLVSADVLGDLIARSASDYQAGRELISKSLKSENITCYLLLDGYDELLAHQLNLANSVLDVILKQLPNTQVVVTTRPHRRRELEEAMGALGFNMCPFEKRSQMEFLTRYWKEVGGAEDNGRLADFALRCLNTLQDNLSEYERDLTGIPLQCMLLARVHRHNAVQYSSSPPPQPPTSPSPPAPPSFIELLPRNICSIGDMYQLLMEEGFSRLAESSVSLGFGERLLHWLHRITLEDTILHAHMFHAIELIFPELSASFRAQLLSSSLPSYNAQIYVPGLLEEGQSPQQPRFVHRTFAEYMVALFIVQFVKLASAKNFQRLLFEGVLSATKRVESIFWLVPEGIYAHSFDNHMICYFLNFLLKSNQDARLTTQKSGRTIPIPRSSLLGFYAASVVHDFPAIATLLTTLFPDSLNSAIDIRWDDLWLLGAKYARVEMLTLLRKFSDPVEIEYPKCLILESSVPITPLDVAVDRGEYDVSVFLFAAGFSALLLSSDSKRRIPNLLHVCAQASSLQSTALVSRKVQIVQYFHLERPDEMVRLLNEKLPNGATPLLLRGIHVHLMSCFIDAGADIHACTVSEDNVLHTFFNKTNIVGGAITPDSFHALVEKLTSAGFAFFGRANTEGRTPLHEAVEAIEVRRDTLDHLLKLKSEENEEKVVVDANARDKAGNSIVMCAVRGGRSRKVISQLVDDNGADLALANGSGETALHLASRSGNVDAVEYLIERGPALLGRESWDKFLNHVDGEGNNALHHAVRNYSPKQSNIQRVLIEAGVQLERVNNERSSPFLTGLKHGRGLCLHTIRLMGQHGLALDLDEMGQGLGCLLTNLLSWEWDGELSSAAEYLIERGAVAGWKDGGDPWSRLEPTIDKVIQATDPSKRFIGKLTQMGILSETELNTHGGCPAHTSQALYDIAKLVRNAYERVMVSLIASHQPEPYTMLQQVLQLDKTEFMRFVTPPPELSEFMESGEARILFLFTADPDTTITRIHNTTNFKFIPQILKDCWDLPLGQDDVVFALGPPDLNLTGRVFTERLLALQRAEKVVCIVLGSSDQLDLRGVSNIGSIQIGRDVITADDLSPAFLKIARAISSKLKGTYGGLSPDAIHSLSKLSNEQLELLARTKETPSPLMYHRHPARWTKEIVKMLPRNIVSKAIFDHVLGDVILVTGAITQEQLQALYKWSGVVIGKSSNYHIGDCMLVESDEDFIWACKNLPSYTIHLLEMTSGGDFKLIRSRGHRGNIAKHLIANEREALSLQEFISAHCVAEDYKSAVKIVHLPDGARRNKFLGVLQDIAPALISLRIADIVSTIRKYSTVQRPFPRGVIVTLRILIELLCSHDVTWGGGLDEPKAVLQLVVQVQVLTEEELEALMQLVELILCETSNLMLWIVRVDAGERRWGLEGQLGLVEYEMRGESRESQAKLISEFWSVDSSLPMQQLEAFANTCVEEYDNRVLSQLPVYCDVVRANWREWYSPPENVDLVCSLIGKCFAEEVATAAGSNATPQSISNLTFINLLSKFIELGFPKDDDGEVDDQALSSLEVGIISLAQLAVMAKFPDWTNIFKVEESRRVSGNRLSSGIIVGSQHDDDDDGSHCFEFDEFAWYLIALMLVNPKYSESLDKKLLEKFICSVVLFCVVQVESECCYKFKHNKLVYFVNSLLPLFPTHPHCFAHVVRTELSKQEIIPLSRAAVVGNHLNILKLVEEADLVDELVSNNNPRIVGEAILFGDVALVKYICELYTSLNGHSDIHQMFIKTVFSYSNRLWTLLELAVFRGCYPICEHLIRSCCGSAENGTLRNQRLLHACLKFSQHDSGEVVGQKGQIVQLLLKLEPTLLEEKDSDGDTPILVEQAHVDLLNLLISAGADAGRRNKRGLTMLQLAAATYLPPAQFHRLISHMVVAESKTDALSLKDHQGYSILSSALLQLELLPETLYIFHSKTNIFNESVPTHLGELHAAIFGGRSASIISKLTELYSTSRKPRFGEASFLHWAALAGNLSAIKVLISKGVDVNVPLDNNATPLHYAFTGPPKANLLETVRLLLECGAESSPKDNQNLSPLQYSLFFNKSPNVLNAVRLLLSHGRSLSEKNFLPTEYEPSSKNKWHISPEKVSQQEFHDLVHFLEGNGFGSNLRKEDPTSFGIDHALVDAIAIQELTEETLQIFLKYCPINPRETGLDTVLFKAIRMGWSLNFLQMLIRYGADPKSGNCRKENVLHVAAQVGNVAALQFFISQFDINGVDIGGNTPLHHAVQGQEVEGISPNPDAVLKAVQFLVDHGADAKLKNGEGLTPLEIKVSPELRDKLDLFFFGI